MYSMYIHPLISISSITYSTLVDGWYVLVSGYIVVFHMMTPILLA